ncbi:hypothetical protein H2200_011766 [Cladophialophora chaetospira]|uniref:histidine kinase n=1 Tax=Cladophialophora chaetospira TaxID=386627 RepID=A0AA38WYQ0_9EURO|nr:hypothetical protein H2200_011766 [Cladophialophora chaetospira]
MSSGTALPKASEQFRERLVSRYFSAVKDLARPDAGVDITDSESRGSANFTPKSSPDTALNAFAQLLLLRLHASHALISLLDARHQYVLAEAAKSSAGRSNAVLKDVNGLWIGSVVLPRETGICSTVLRNTTESASYHVQDHIADPDVVVINDLKEDARFSSRRFVAGGPQMRWYAGAPIRSPDGTKIGAVCVFDSQPRQDFSEDERLFLTDTAKTVMNHLEAVRIQSEFQRRDRLIEGLEAFVGGLSELASLNQRKEVVNGDIIVREAGGYDGAAFFYVPSTESSGKSRSRQDRQDDPGSTLPGARPSTTSGSSTCSSGEEESVNSRDSQLEQDVSSGDETSSNAICPILGFSMSQEEEKIRSSNQLQFPRFLVRDMRRLMGSRPRGRVYMLDTLGAALPGDTSSSGEGGEPRAPNSNGTTNDVSPVPQPRHKRNRAVQLKALVKLEPKARAFICLPLWDYTRQRWFAFSVYWILNPIRDPAADRDLTFLQVFGNSITNALAHLDSLEESRAKDTFVSSVSHELRSPLHGILGATNFLYDSNLGRFQHEMVNTITSCGRTLLDSLEHIMDFAKINNFSKTNNNILKKIRTPKKQETESRRKRVLATSSLTSSVDMNLVIEEVVEAVVLGFTVQHDFLHSEDAIAGVGVQIPNFITKPQDLSKSSRTRSIRGRVRICLDLPAANSHFETQPGAWRRIVMNLVGNALKYTDEGSISISLRVQNPEHSAEGQESGKANQSKVGTWLVLTVKDTGIGMSNEFMQNHIFKAFAQEDSLAVGTGLGLNIVDQVVTFMDGHVDVSSAKGFGSTFGINVTLKRGEDRQSAKTNPITSLGDRLKGLSICILEDINSRASDKNSESMLRAEELFSRSLIRTLQEWFGINVVVTSQFEPGTADVVICLEPSFRQLQLVRSSSVGGPIPPVLFIAHDALEVAVLRDDSRITSPESFVEITCQPLGPRKLAAALVHCLDQSRLYSPKGSEEASLSGDSCPSPLPSSGTASADASLAIGVRLRPDGSRSGELQGDDSLPSNNNKVRKERSFVLCVDDNPLNLRLLTAFVAKNKLPFEQAANGQVALDMYMAAPTSFRCVLMDISMPVMDGMTATRLMREHETKNALPRVPIFALTGLASAAARNEAIEAGIDRLFTKPVPFSALNEILSQSKPPPKADGVGTDSRT